MNVLDTVLILTIILYFAKRGTLSLVYYFFITFGYICGLLMGLLMATGVGNTTDDYIVLGSVSLVLMFGLAIILGYAGLRVGQYFRIKVLDSNFFTLDKVLVWPYKIIAAVIVLVIFSQSLIYIPLLGLQFQAQGSSILMVTDKITPSTPIEGLARNIAPAQFEENALVYDQKILVDGDVKDEGSFINMIESVSPSIVKIARESCTGEAAGSGFVVSPGLVVTNAHVIAGSKSAFIRDREGSYPATPLVIDRDFDIAILYSKFLNAQPLQLASSPPASGAVGTNYWLPQH